MPTTAPSSAKQDSVEMVTTSSSMADEANRPGRILDLHKDFFFHRRTLYCCAVMSIGGFQFGFDLSAIAGMQAMPGFLQVFGFPDPTAVLGYGIDPTVQQLINSLMSIGAFVACVSVGPLGNYLSRKWSIVLGIVLNHLGVILMMVAKDLATLYAGRLIIGLANGYLDILPQLYIHETAPAYQRGALLGGFNAFIGVGLLVGSIAANYTAKIIGKEAYLIPLGLFLVVPSIIGVALPFLPETPRWLMEHGKEEKARKAIWRLRNQSTEPELIEAELEEIREALETEKRLSQGVKIFDLFRKANLRRTMLSLALLLSLSGSGALFLLGYGTYFFSVAGQTKAFEENVGMTAAGLVATIFSMWLITKVGRRTVLLFGFASQGICMIIVAATSEKGMTETIGKVMVAFTIMYIFFYNLCCAPYLYLVAGEIPSQRLRGYTLGIAIAISFFFSWLVSYTAPYFINPLELNWGPKYGYIWFGSNFIIFVCFYFWIPETKDRTLEEIDEMFEDNVPARKFKGYVCVRAHNAEIVGSQRVTGDKEGVPAQHLENA
ncbi:general substrate transporter [Lineolata rhizophorae]|uniref:General substrate transporter n=1 Tax=Lineolata rhizophorae TaxID=578093 RepID=A0A6A6PB45_9PEZI|nr:general substrate transporter [Lineolata rhizophorae]